MKIYILITYNRYFNDGDRPIFGYTNSEDANNRRREIEKEADELEISSNYGDDVRRECAIFEEKYGQHPSEIAICVKEIEIIK